MNKIISILMAGVLFLTLLLTPCAMRYAGNAEAATTNYSEVITGIQVVPLFVAGQRTATVTPIKFQLPFKAQVLGVSATARASSGTTPTLTVDVQEGGASILSSAISVTAGTVSEGTISDTSLADESTITVVLTIGGGTPTWDDIMVLLTIRRTN